MPQPDDESSDKAIKSLDARLKAFEAGRQSGPRGPSAERSMGEGYRLLGEVVGGVFGGLGFGWLFDHFAHTTPWGLVAGMLIGTAFSAYVAYRSAGRTAEKISGTVGQKPAAPSDEDDE
jgi:ATP synthase protein I